MEQLNPKEKTTQNLHKLERTINLLKIYTFFSYLTSVFYLIFILIWFNLNAITVAQLFIYNLLTIVVGLIINNLFSNLSDKLGNRTFFLMFQDVLSALALLIIIFYINLITIAIFAFLVYAISRESLLTALFYDIIEKREIIKRVDNKDFEEQKAKEFTKFRILGSIGWAIGGPIAGFFIMIWGFQITFAIPVILHFSTFIYLFCIRRELNEASLNEIKSKEVLINKKVFKTSIFRNTEFLILLLVMFIFEIGRSISHSIKPVYAAELGGSYLYIGLLAFTWALCEVPLFFLSSKIVESNGYKIPIILGAVFVIIRYFFYIFIITPQNLLLFLLLETLNTFGILWPAITFAINHMFAQENKALGTSIYITFVAVARFLGNFFGMLFAFWFDIGGNYQDYRILFVFGLIVDLMGLAFFLGIIILKKKKLILKSAS